MPHAAIVAPIFSTVAQLTESLSILFGVTVAQGLQVRKSNRARAFQMTPKSKALVEASAVVWLLHLHAHFHGVSHDGGMACPHRQNTLHQVPPLLLAPVGHQGD